MHSIASRYCSSNCIFVELVRLDSVCPCGPWLLLPTYCTILVVKSSLISPWYQLQFWSLHNVVIAKTFNKLCHETLLGLLLNLISWMHLMHLLSRSFSTVFVAFVRVCKIIKLGSVHSPTDTSGKRSALLDAWFSGCTTNACYLEKLSVSWAAFAMLWISVWV